MSAYASSPTFGGGSWLAHASFMSGVEVRDAGDYMLLLTQERDTWPKLFKAAGYRAIAVMPGMRSSWPEGAFYGFDAIHDEPALEYRGPEFGWWRIPDQFSLARVAELEARNDSHEPLLTFLPTINTHIPFLPVPPYQADWQRVLEAAAVSRRRTSKRASRRCPIGKPSASRTPTRSSIPSRISPAICARAPRRTRRSC